MTDKLFITNRTNKPMVATISENITGHNVLSYQLQPGANELNIKDLNRGLYMINLQDETHAVIYTQTVTKD